MSSVAPRNDARSSRTIECVLGLPAAFVVVLAATVCVLQLAALVGVEPLHSARLSAGLTVAMTVAWGGVSLVISRHSEIAADPTALRMSLAAPAVMLGYAAVGRGVLGVAWMEWFLGGDNVRHVVLVADTLNEGNLSYAESAYPRGWHAMLATIWASHGGNVDTDNIASFIELVAFASWTLTALLALALAGLTLSLQRRLSVTGWPTLLAVSLTAAFVLTPRFSADFLALGFQTSVLGALIMAVSIQVALRERQDATSVTIAAACCVAVSHAWQILLPAVILVFLVTAMRFLVARQRASLCVVGVAILLTAMAAAAPVVGLVAKASPAVVGTSGATPSIPWLFLAPSALALLALAFSGAGRVLTVALMSVAAPAATAAGVVVMLGLVWSDYYPTKMLWTTAVLALPFLAVSMARLVAWGVSVDGLRAPVGVTAASVLCLAGLLGLVTPAGALIGAWSTVDSARVLGAIGTRGAADARAVWMDSSTETAVTRTLLYVYDPDRPLGAFPDRLSVAEECFLLGTARSRVVVSSQPLRDTLQRYSCSDVTVLRVPD